MPLAHRKTVVLRFTYRADDATPLPLDDNRRYDVTAAIDRETFTANQFSTPFGDERWREIIEAMRQCASERSAPGVGDESEENAGRRRNRRRAEEVEEAGRKLYAAIADLAPALRVFLEDVGPRRLVIESKRPEIHALPWETLTGERGAHVAGRDLSIVRSQAAFNPIAQPSPSLLSVYAASGPNVPEETLEAVKSIGVTDEASRRIGVAIVEQDKAAGDQSDQQTAQLVFLVAHGEQYEATVAVAPGEALLPSQLAERFHDRLMLLLWSCYSANVLSTGDSVAMALQRAKNQFVLSFAAPLNFDAGNQIAAEFFNQVFGERGQQDPETAVTRIRAQLREQAFEFCDWASMTLWLDRPVDLSRLPLGRMRLPRSGWSDRSVDDVPAPIRTEFERAALGELRLISNATVAKPLPLGLVRQWGGPVVHLDGPNALRQEGIFEPLKLDPRRDTHPHDADLFLHLLDHLATYRYALIIWSGIGVNHALLVQTLERIPANVGMVLISKGDLESAWPGRPDGETSSTTRSATAPLLVGREGFLYLVQNERFEAALKLAGDAHFDDVEYWNGMYLAGVKTNRRETAREAIERLKTIDPIESDLLQGNLHARDGNPLSALDAYQKAGDAAFAASRWRDFARVRLEISYVFEEMGDRGLAQQLYRAAIELLNETPDDPKERNSLWTSALARTLRDDAHLLAKDSNPDALPLVRRATAIHALEGRRTQAAYCYVTRSELACNLGHYDEAERFVRQATIVFEAAQNKDGWLDCVRLLARVAAARSRFDQALEILRRAAARPLKHPAVGLLFRDIAEICWASGRIDEAAASARGAAALLGRKRRALTDSQRLLAVTQALAPPGATPRVATLAGRMLDNSSADGSQVLDDLRLRLCRCFVEQKTEALVCSAARGADLIALEMAGRMGIRRRIVLPFGVEKFRKTSVEKPLTAWNDLYQQVIDDAARRNDLVIVESAGSSYKDANARILDEAAALADGGRPTAIVVWEGHARDEADMTAGFKRSAESRGFDVKEIRVET